MDSDPQQDRHSIAHPPGGSALTHRARELYDLSTTMSQFSLEHHTDQGKTPVQDQGNMDVDKDKDRNKDIHRNPCLQSSPQGRDIGWDHLPVECIQHILSFLESDTFALGALVQVNRVLFFWVVPLLYRDPIQRILDLTNKKRIRFLLDLPTLPLPLTRERSLLEKRLRGQVMWRDQEMEPRVDGGVDVSAERTRPFMDATATIATATTTTSPMHVLESTESNSSSSIHNNNSKNSISNMHPETRHQHMAVMKLLLETDTKTLSRQLRSLQDQRELGLLKTLLAPLFLQILDRYWGKMDLSGYQVHHYRDMLGIKPGTVSHFIYRPDRVQLHQQEMKRFARLSEGGEEAQGGSKRGWSAERARVDRLAWTTDWYFRHWVCRDLERLLTRTKGKDKGIFQDAFGPNWRGKETQWGMLDRFQRLMMNQAPEQVQTLKIPGHRLRTFQLRHERVERAGKTRSRTKKALEKMRQERKEAKRLARGTRSDDKERGSSGSDDDDDDDGDDDEVIVLPDKSVKSNEPQENQDKPLCFTFQKLTHLRRLEVSRISDNAQDWETLERVIASMQYKDFRGGPPSARIHDTIVEFSIRAQSCHHQRLDTILSLFGNLQVLELRYDFYSDRPLITNTVTQVLGKSLKVLRIGANGWDMNGECRYEDLGRFVNLVELKVMVSEENQFQWVVRRKEAEARWKAAADAAGVASLGQRSIIQQNRIHSTRRIKGRAYSDQAIEREEEDDDSDENDSRTCLPHLKRLALTSLCRKAMHCFNVATKAFGPQLQELVLRVTSVSYNTTSFHWRLDHPCFALRRLVIRGDAVRHFDFACLPEHCPNLESAAFQYSQYAVHELQDRRSVDNEGIIRSLVQCKKLKHLYLEGIWLLEDHHLLELVSPSSSSSSTLESSLTLLGIYDAQCLTMEGIAFVHEILSERGQRSGYPLKRAGVVRLSNDMANYDSKDYLWNISFFNYDD